MNCALKAALAAIMLLRLAAPTAAGVLEDAADAYRRGDYGITLRAFRPLADQGDATAQSLLGEMYALGQGVPQNDAEAVKWWRKAAGQGDASAQYNLGSMYDKGQGVPQDYAAALSWYRMAADQGDADAQFNLAAMYDKGQGVSQDYINAHMWFDLAAAQGDLDAMEQRSLVEKRMTKSQLAEALKLSREWKPKPTPRPALDRSSPQRGADLTPF